VPPRVARRQYTATLRRVTRWRPIAGRQPPGRLGDEQLIGSPGLASAKRSARWHAHQRDHGFWPILGPAGRRFYARSAGPTHLSRSLSSPVCRRARARRSLALNSRQTCQDRRERVCLTPWALGRGGFFPRTASTSTLDCMGGDRCAGANYTTYHSQFHFS
jgi:hypothetical protein